MKRYILKSRKTKKKTHRNSTRQTGLNGAPILVTEHKDVTNPGIQELIVDIKKKTKSQEKCLNWGIIEEFLEKQQTFEFFNY